MAIGSYRPGAPSAFAKASAGQDLRLADGGPNGAGSHNRNTNIHSDHSRRYFRRPAAHAAGVAIRRHELADVSLMGPDPWRLLFRDSVALDRCVFIAGHHSLVQASRRHLATNCWPRDWNGNNQSSGFGTPPFTTSTVDVPALRVLSDRIRGGGRTVLFGQGAPACCADDSTSAAV